MNHILNEGLRAGDLEDLVLPLVSIDEFESKIDPSALVIGFYVGDLDAAGDLNRFLQKSTVDILDCDISPAPDQHGYYMVFVELLNNARVAENVEGVVQEVSALTNIDNWKAHLRGTKGLSEFDAKALTKSLKKDPSLSESVLDFLTTSDLHNAKVDGDKLILESVRESTHWQIVAFGPLDETMREHRLDESPVSFGFGDVAVCKRLISMLGEGWTAHRVGDLTVVQNVALQPQVLLLRN